jgi:hypothetical protein
VKQLLKRLQDQLGTQAKGRIMRVGERTIALTRACKEIGIPKLTHHDLRQLFATRCIESGVDIPTVARWLGHKDGGALTGRSAPHWSQRQSSEWQGMICSRRSRWGGNSWRPGWLGRGFLALGSGLSFSAAGRSASVWTSAAVTLGSADSKAVWAGESFSPLGSHRRRLSSRIFLSWRCSRLSWSSMSLAWRAFSACKIWQAWRAGAGNESSETI